MRPADNIKRFIDKAAVSTHPHADEAVLEAVLAAQRKATDKTSAATRPSLRSIAMRSPITTLAAAAVVVAAVVLFIGLWDKSAPAAYALDMTIEANQSVRWLHIKNFTIGHAEPREGWIEFGADGQARRARSQVPDWASPVEGAWVLAWKDDTVQRWTKKENRLMIAKAGNVREQLTAVLQELDPRQIVAHIADLEQRGQVEIVTEEPPDKTKPIVVTVTYLPGSDKPGRRKVLAVDPVTKLVNTIGLYEFQDGQYRQEGTIELREYNQPIDPKRFDLTSEAPPSAQRLDLSATNLGFPQGLLNDEQAATETVRAFFEALIDQDYEEAGRLIPIGTAALKEHFGKAKVLRIVSVGPATPTAQSQDKELTVPCTIEYEEDGKKATITLQGIRVGELPQQPGRWIIQTLGD
ncbi:MAG: hypothetical protein MUC88_05575 [Planctomycetes bacterium]|jgi:hypothetical protein|nr:hypothetical protein [Planctomycetota bacterium]